MRGKKCLSLLIVIASIVSAVYLSASQILASENPYVNTGKVAFTNPLELYIRDGQVTLRLNTMVVKRGLTLHDDGFATFNLFDWTHEEEMDFCEKYLEEVVTKADIKKYAVRVINKLKKEGNYIYIITSRKEPHFKCPYELTKGFLDNAGIHYDKLIVGCEDKNSFCIEHNIDVMIDDEPQNINAISKRIPVIVFEGIQNIKCSGHNILKVSNWKEAYNAINTINKKAFTEAFIYDSIINSMGI